MPSTKYEFLEHPSDIKIRAFGKELPELFINAALGMMDFLYGSQGKLRVEKNEEIFVEAENLESLLVNWLAEILWLSDTKHCLCIDFNITNFSKKSIKAYIGLAQAIAKDDIKAVTYHDLKIVKQDAAWIAEVVFDI